MEKKAPIQKLYSLPPGNSTGRVWWINRKISEIGRVSRKMTRILRSVRGRVFGTLFSEKFPKSVEFPGGSSFPENDTDSEIGERSSFWHFIFRKFSKIYLQRLKKYVFPRFFVLFSGASRQILSKRSLSSPKSPGLELSGGVEFPRGVGFPGGSSFPENDCDLKMA